MKHFIIFMFPNIQENDTIISGAVGGANKSDLFIQVGSIKYNISIKEGSGNSVHQEPVEDFIAFLEQAYHITDDLANDIRFFIWGDGTLYGNGKKEDRVSATTFKKKYPDLLFRINAFFQQ